MENSFSHQSHLLHIMTYDKCNIARRVPLILGNSLDLFDKVEISFLFKKRGAFYSRDRLAR